MSFFKPEELYRLKNLRFVADRVVEGFLYGFHKSPYSGVNIEFFSFHGN
jgi:predicted GNAT superfamily acetyltransferase